MKFLNFNSKKQGWWVLIIYGLIVAPLFFITDWNEFKFHPLTLFYNLGFWFIVYKYDLV